MTLAQKEAKVKSLMKEYRTTRDKVVRFLREKAGLTFSEIGQQFGFSRARAWKLYKDAIGQ